MSDAMRKLLSIFRKPLLGPVDYVLAGVMLAFFVACLIAIEGVSGCDA